MKPDRVVDELTRAAQKLGIRVRVAPFKQRGASAGGMCRVAGRPLVLLDELASPIDRAIILADALLGFDLAGVGFSDEASAVIRRRRGPGSTRASASELRAELGEKPGIAACKPRRRRS